MQHLWNERYAAEGFAYGTEANVFLAEQLPKIPVGKYYLLVRVREEMQFLQPN